MTSRTRTRRGPTAGIVCVTVLAEILLTLAAVCGLYLVWMQWWTGVESAHDQYEARQSAAWLDSSANATKIAPPQSADNVPVQPQSAQTGELMGVVYIPRFGSDWNRNLVQGVDLPQLNMAGLGHYPTSQMPGEIGNIAIAGHRNGYGQPLGDVDQLKPGDPIIIRTQDYWYVYDYTSYEIVTPDDTAAVTPNPFDPSQPPTTRMLTLTTCEPKYSAPTHRWISYAQFKYWAKVSDGIPAELAEHSDTGGTNIALNTFDKPNVLVQLGSLFKPFVVLAAAYLVLFIAAAVAWQWPRKKTAPSGFYSVLLRAQPGPAAVRWILITMLALLAVMALFQWGFPWAATHIDFLAAMSNYTAIQ